MKPLSFSQALVDDDVDLDDILGGSTGEDGFKRLCQQQNTHGASYPTALSHPHSSHC